MLVHHSMCMQMRHGMLGGIIQAGYWKAHQPKSYTARQGQLSGPNYNDGRELHMCIAWHRPTGAAVSERTTGQATGPLLLISFIQMLCQKRSSIQHCLVSDHSTNCSPTVISPKSSSTACIPVTPECNVPLSAYSTETMEMLLGMIKYKDQCVSPRLYNRAGPQAWST